MRTRPASKAQAEDATTSDAVFYVITSTKVLRLVWASRGLDPGSSAAGGLDPGIDVGAA